MLDATLMAAIKTGRHDELKAALSPEAIEAATPAGETLLHHAAAQGNVEAVDLLLEAGADPNGKTTPWRGRPVLYALWNDEPEAMQRLLEANARLGAAELHGAMRRGNDRLMRLLCDAGLMTALSENPSLQAALRAVYLHDLDTLQRTLDQQPGLLHAVDSGGRTLLHAAAGAGHVDVVGLLVERGAEVDHRDPDRDTPLVAATYFGRLDVAARLVQAGADVTALPDPRSYQHHSRQHHDGDPPLDGAETGVLEARHLPNPCDEHESILYAKPPCDQTWFYQTQVHNPLAMPLRIVWFDAFGRWEDHWHPGNVKGRPLNGLDFSQWYGDGDRPLKHGVIEPGQTARCDVNWHCGWGDEPPPGNKWAYRAVADDGRAFYAEAVIESVPYPESNGQAGR